jgi:hypothetical protein
MEICAATLSALAGSGISLRTAIQMYVLFCKPFAKGFVVTRIKSLFSGLAVALSFLVTSPPARFKPALARSFPAVRGSNHMLEPHLRKLLVV